MTISNSKLSFFEKFIEYENLSISEIIGNKEKYIICSDSVCGICKVLYCDKMYGVHIFTKEDIDEIKLLYPEYFI